MSTRLIRRLLVLGAAVGAMSCGDSEDKVAGGCDGSVATEAQEGNKINLTGNFAGGQPIMQVTQNDVTQSFVADTYDKGTASIDITGLAKGTYTVTWILSCFNEDGEVTMTSTIKNITIT